MKKKISFCCIENIRCVDTFELIFLLKKIEIELKRRASLARKGMSHICGERKICE